MSYTIIFNNKINEELGIEIIKRPIIPIQTKKYKEIEIEGKDGKFYQDSLVYENLNINIEFNFAEENLNNLKNRVRKIKRWLYNVDDNKLILSDDKQYYFKVCKLDMGEVTYEEIYEIQKFNVIFTVEPYQFFIDNEELLLSKSFYNNWDVCKPKFRIIGNGSCNFSINDVTITCVVNGELTIDTEFDKILNYDKTLAIGKTNIKAMQDLYLKEEENVFNWSNGFNVYITPNFRTL